MAESRSKLGNTNPNTNPNPVGNPTLGYDQMQVVAQVIDLRMDVRALETKTDRAILDISGLTSETKSGLKAVHDLNHATAIDHAKLVERVNHLPSKGFIVVALLLSLSVLGALIVFQGNIARMIGAVPVGAVSTVGGITLPQGTTVPAPLP